MSSWATLFFVASIFLLFDTSPTISSPLEVAPQLQEGALSSKCPSCSLSQMRKNLSSSGGQSDMVEAVKSHILNMLHLSARPNLTMPVPRAALLNAIKKLHVGRVTEDGTVEILEESSGSGTSTAPEPPSELIIFGEPGESPNTVTFDILKKSGSGAVVEEANVWIFLKMSKVSRVRRKVMLQLLWTCHDGGSHKDEFVSEKMVDSRRSGWHTLTVTHSVQTLLDGGSTSLSLRVSCTLCAEVGASPILTPGDRVKAAGQDQSHRPFLMVMLRASDEPQRRVKRGLECNDKIHVCCKRQFYVNFKDIGWSDWIIAPSGYHANYCEGDCPSHMASSALSFHAAVISHYRMRGYGPFQNMKSCCVPTRLRAMSMLYYNEEQKIIKKDIQNMIVEECGCS